MATPAENPPKSPSSESGDTAAELIGRLDATRLAGGSILHEVEHLHRLAMVGTLGAGVIHEINNLLTPALCEAQLAHLHLDNPERLRQALEQCILSITQASRIADVLMKLAGDQSTAGRTLAGEPPVATVADVLRSALACLGPQPSRRLPGLTIESNIPPSTQVRIDPIALQQVFLNLLLNSILALRQTPHPAIRITAHEVAGGLVEMTFEDNGPGIEPAIRPTLFQPFATSKPTGTGLGLMICQQLIQQAGGTIKATEPTSTEPRGAIFSISLASTRRDVSGKPD